jgi:hypothetical protein
MFWFFERKGEHLRCEIRSQIEGDRYDLIITKPDGSESVERFGNSKDLERRTLELEHCLVGAGWNGPFRPDW